MDWRLPPGRWPTIFEELQNYQRQFHFHFSAWSLQFQTPAWEYLKLIQISNWVHQTYSTRYSTKFAFLLCSAIVAPTDHLLSLSNSNFHLKQLSMLDTCFLVVQVLKVEFLYCQHEHRNGYDLHPKIVCRLLFVTQILHLAFSQLPTHSQQIHLNVKASIVVIKIESNILTSS